MKFYTGIGARETPDDICEMMYEKAAQLYAFGWTLRSGKAIKGADRAFQLGLQAQTRFDNHSDMKAAEIYIPWKTFKGGDRLVDTWDIYNWPQECYHIASEIHPAWDKCSRGAKALHSRNVPQVLGKDLATPSKFVLYWAEEKPGGEPKGGTRTAVVLARKHNIPTINMLFDDWEEKLDEVLHGY